MAMRQSVFTILNDAAKQVLLSPYVEQASRELAGTRFGSMLTTECQAQLIEDFCRVLVAYAQDTLNSLAAQKLAKQNWLWGLNAALAPSAKVAEARVAVAAQIQASDGAVIDEAAPLLRTELQRQTARFVATTTELLERVWRDRSRIADELLGKGADGEIGTISDLDMRLADCHDGGRRTAVVTCEAGRFVYKPRNCSIGPWFAGIAQKYLAGALRQPRTILRHDESGYWGFEEFIERTPVTDKDGVARYWRNFGRATALFHALGSEDLHCENFVAAGETPSLVDMETVITSEPTQLGDPLTSPRVGRASKGFGRDIANTLATSSLLPSITDQEFNTSPLIARNCTCLPLWEGHEHDVCGYVDDFLHGFDEGWVTLAARADELADDLCAATHMPVRRLIRNTVIYVRLLARLRLCDAYDRAKRDELLSILHRPLIRGIEATTSPLATSEIACLLEGDIPYFYAEAGSRTITGSDGTSDVRLLAASAQERALWRIRALDDSHHSFVHALLADNLHRALVPTDGCAPACRPLEEPLSTEDALAEAHDIFQRLEQLVIESPSGESSWLFRDDQHTLVHSSVELGGGLGGMAVFLAALAPRTQDAHIRSLALERLDGCLNRIEEIVACLEVAHVIPEHSATLGMADGLGGVVRTLDLVVGALNEDAGRADRASDLQRRLLGVLPRVDIEHTTHADVYSGNAGLLLALAESPLATQDEAAVDVVERLVRRLLEQRGVGEDGLLWDTLNTGWPISGFAHGQAGIACALARATQTFGIDTGTTVRDALAFELAAYNERIGTWPDLRKTRVSDIYMHGICSGAPGVGLAAITAAKDAPSPEAHDLAQSLLGQADKTCAKLPIPMRDVLCCGSLSVTEYLLERGMRHEAGRILAGVVHRKRELGTYVLYQANWRQSDDAAFLWGLAGIGYELLRYADPHLAHVF